MRGHRQEEIQARLYLGPCCTREQGKQVTGFLVACSWSPGELVPYIRGVGGASRGEVSSGFRVFCPPLCDVVCREHTQYLCFSSQLFRNGLCVFSLFASFIKNLPNCTCTQLSSVPYSFFVFFCSRRHLSRWKHLQHQQGFQVPACLINRRLLFLAVPAVIPFHSSTHSHILLNETTLQSTFVHSFPRERLTLPIYPEGFIFRVS